MLFPDRLLNGIADPPSRQRGAQYFREGAVRDVTVRSLPDGRIEVCGLVDGSDTYASSLTFSPSLDRIADYACTCPYDWGGACKHVVALGLAAQLLNADLISDDRREEGMEDRIRRVLGDLAQRKGFRLSRTDLASLSRELAGIGAVPAADRPPFERIAAHPLDAIVLRLSYAPAEDRVDIAAEARHGPVVVPVGAVDEAGTLERDGVTHVARRNLRAENICQRRLSGWPFDGALAQGRLSVSGDDRIYWFVENILPEIKREYKVEIDPSFEPLRSVRRERVETDWKTRAASGIDFFEFSAEWHAGKTDVTIDELRKMARSPEPYVRGPDGSFIVCDNRKEVERLLAFADRAKKLPSGAFRLRLFDAPELMEAIESTKGARLRETTDAFRALIERVHRGAPVAPPSFPRRLARALRPYQKDGVAWGLFLQECRFGGILADDMGLGKTLQALALLRVSKRRGRSLVVCPKTLVHVWLREAAAFTPELSCAAVAGSAAERKKTIASSKADVLITSYSLLLRDIKEYRKDKGRFFACVLDEAQAIKNASTAAAKAVKLVPCDHRLALTGTPLENGLHELWSIFDFLMPGFLADARTFRARYERPIAEHGDRAALEELRRKVRPFMLRRTKESELKELPAKIEQTSLCELAPEQLVAYARALEKVRGDVFRAVEAKGFKRSRIEILAALTRLRQICNHPALVDARLPRSAALSGKLERALELVREAVGGGHKVLLFSQFTSMLDLIRPLLDEHGIGHATIEGKTRDRAAEAARFADPSVGVFLLSLKAGGTGLTLTEADTVILFDPWWNPMVERQAMDRAHRIGQTKTVNVYRLIAEGTVEEKVLALQKRKKDVFDAMMADGTGVDPGKLTWNDLKGLFDA